MILVDTSIWIDVLDGSLGACLEPEDLVRFATCGPIIQEVVQGIRQASAAARIARSLMAMERLSDPLPADVFLLAADIYRTGRRRGRTIRSPVDCLIAAVAIENDVPVWHRDRDFDAIARFTPLRAVRKLLR